MKTCDPYSNACSTVTPTSGSVAAAVSLMPIGAMALWAPGIATAPALAPAATTPRLAHTRVPTGSREHVVCPREPTTVPTTSSPRCENVRQCEREGGLQRAVTHLPVDGIDRGSAHVDEDISLSRRGERDSLCRDRAQVGRKVVDEDRRAQGERACLLFTPTKQTKNNGPLCGILRFTSRVP